MPPITTYVSYGIVAVDLLLETTLLYMILFKTPKRMRSFKVYLGLLCVNSTALSIATGVVWQPEFLTPPICIYSEGIFKNLISSRLITAVVGELMVQYIQLLLVSYFFVYSKMNSVNFKPFTPRRIVANCAFIQIPAALYGFLVYNSNASDAYVRNHTTIDPDQFSSISCYFTADLEADSVVIYNICFIAVYFLVFIVTAMCLLRRVYKKLKNPASFTSARTLQLQKMFFSNIIVQSLIPVVFVALPVFVSIGYAFIRRDEFGSVFFKIVFLSVTAHSLVSCSLIIWVTKPYKKHFLVLLRVKRKETRDSVASMSVAVMAVKIWKKHLV